MITALGNGICQCWIVIHHVAYIGIPCDLPPQFAWNDTTIMKRLEHPGGSRPTGRPHDHYAARVSSHLQDLLGHPVCGGWEHCDSASAISGARRGAGG